MLFRSDRPCRRAGDIAAISRLIDKLEMRAGMPQGKLHLVPWIETAEAIVNVAEICRASERIVAVAFGGEDFTNDMGVERLEDEAQIAYARQSLCVAARAAHVLALDTPYFKLRNPDGLRDNSLRAKSIGFKGKFAIHPEQIDTLNECFSPSAQEVAHAERVVAAYEEAERRGRASTSLDGWVIDVPVVKRARALLELARRARAERERRARHQPSHALRPADRRGPRPPRRRAARRRQRRRRRPARRR